MEFDLGRQRSYFHSGATRTREMRLRHLRSLAAAVARRRDEIAAALADDLGKSAVEAYASETGFVLRDIEHACRHLQAWMRPRRVHTPLAARPGSARIVPEPLGVVLILSPWNYPLQLALSPLVAALAAGNCAVVKPSEHAPATARLLADICSQSFPAELVTVLPGDARLSAELCGMKFDHILFTGSTAVGRKVAAAAAENLVPLTLELGGKSPCVVCEDADIALAARRIMWGKTMNAGQTCVAPDYVLAHESIHSELLDALADCARSFSSGRDYGRIVNSAHFERLLGLLAGSEIHAGGEADADTLTIRPAILKNVGRLSPVMKEEIFGPLLPVLKYSDLSAEIDILVRGPSPLAAYIFTGDQVKAELFERRLRCGSICVNDTLTQLFPADLPFGGVGQSGYGRYHGRAGFDTFSNLKAVMRRSTRGDSRFRYPPYRITAAVMHRFYRWLMR